MTTTPDTPQPADRGSAMVITLMVLALVTALSTTVAVVTIDNMIGSRKAQQAGAALAAADAGIAQAMTHLRNNGVRDLDCTSADPASAACDALWGSDNPAKVNVPGDNGASYQVWIEAVRPFPENDPGEYKIHSWGQAVGPASRRVVTTVSVGSAKVPKGIFARTISGGGTADVTRESIFSSGCVYNRSKIDMDGVDVAYGIPAAVHSSQSITDSNENSQYCPGNKPIHEPTKPCDPSYPFDQDVRGGDLAGTACKTKADALPADQKAAYAKYYPATLTKGVRGSYIKDDTALFDLFGIRSPALTQTQIDQLKSIAQSQGNYHTDSTGWTSPNETNAVMFFDLQGANYGEEVDLNNIAGFGRAGNLADGTGCPTRSLIILIEGGNAKLNSNQQLAASLFLLSGAPYGQVVKANGNSQFIGTIYADKVNLVGTTEISLDPCFLANLSPGLMDFQLEDYQELDRF
jgi:hypothetical protein